jgi:prevent-host-death family protein
MKTKKKTIPASEFKAKCLKILDHLGPEGITVTKRGRPVAKVIPAGGVDNSKLIGSMKGKVKIRGNIFSTGRKWDAQSRHPRLDLAYHR